MRKINIPRNNSKKAADQNDLPQSITFLDVIVNYLTIKVAAVEYVFTYPFITTHLYIYPLISGVAGGVIYLGPSNPVPTVNLTHVVPPSVDTYHS